MRSIRVVLAVSMLIVCLPVVQFGVGVAFSRLVAPQLSSPVPRLASSNFIVQAAGIGVSQAGSAGGDYGMWVYNSDPMLGQVKVWVQNTAATSDITAAIQYAQTALNAWNQEYPAYALNMTYAVHVQEQGEAAPPDPEQDLLGARNFVANSPYDVFILSGSGGGCGGGVAWMNPPIIYVGYSDTDNPNCRGIAYSTTIHEMGHQVLGLGDLYLGPGPGTWLQTHPLIQGEIMQVTPSYESYSTLDFYGAWKHNQLYQQYGAFMPSGSNNPIYLPGDVPYKWYCSDRQLSPNNTSGLIGCPLPPVLLWTMCPDQNEPCGAQTQTTTSTTTTDTTTPTTTSETATTTSTTPPSSSETTTTLGSTAGKVSISVYSNDFHDTLGTDPVTKTNLGGSIRITYVADGTFHDQTLDTPFTVQVDTNTAVALYYATNPPGGYQPSQMWNDYGHNGGAMAVSVSYGVGTTDHKIVAYFNIPGIQPPGPYTFGIWKTHTFTYNLTGCGEAQRAAFTDAIHNWETWLPEITFTEVQGTATMGMSCLTTELANPPANTSSDAVTTWPDESDPAYNSMFPTFKVALVGIGLIGFRTSYDASGGRNIIAHSIGHALGVKDNEPTDPNGCGWGVMGYCWINNPTLSAQIVPPTLGELNELHQNFGAPTVTAITTITTSETDSTTISTTSAPTTSQSTTATTSSTSTPPPQPQPQSGCIIATSAYGSSMAPEVVYMRHVRDDLIGSTPTGRVLRDWWNWFYYLWSPPIARAIAGNAFSRAVFRLILVPVSVAVRVADFTFSGTGMTDASAVAAFLLAALICLSAYVVGPAAAFSLIIQHWRKARNSSE